MVSENSMDNTIDDVKNENETSVDITIEDNTTNNISIKKIIGLQKSFKNEGYSLQEYEKYIQKKVDDNMFHYRKLSKDEIEGIIKRYNKLLFTNKRYKD